MGMEHQTDYARIKEILNFQNKNSFDSMKVAIYVRVSTEEQNLENQILKLKDFAKTQGFDVHKIYKDIISGAKDSRPALDNMMKDLYKGEFKGVLVWKLDRLGRSIPHLVSLMQTFKKYNITFISMTENIDTSTLQGRLLYNIMSSLAEFERELISERTKLGQERARRQGKRIGRPKISSYQRRKIAQLREEGLSIRKIAKQMQVSRSTVQRYVPKKAG